MKTEFYNSFLVENMKAIILLALVLAIVAGLEKKKIKNDSLFDTDMKILSRDAREAKRVNCRKGNCRNGKRKKKGKRRGKGKCRKGNCRNGNSKGKEKRKGKIKESGKGKRRGKGTGIEKRKKTKRNNRKKETGIKDLLSVRQCPVPDASTKAENAFKNYRRNRNTINKAKRMIRFYNLIVSKRDKAQATDSKFKAAADALNKTTLGGIFCANTSVKTEAFAALGFLSNCSSTAATACDPSSLETVKTEIADVCLPLIETFQAAVEVGVNKIELRYMQEINITKF